MRKLLHEVQEIDQYILQKMSVTDKLVFQARMLTNTALQEKVYYQAEAHRMIRRIARDSQREKLAALHASLWESDGSFRAEISAIFK